MKTKASVNQYPDDDVLDSLISLLPDPEARRRILRVLRDIKGIKKYDKLSVKLWQALKTTQEAI
jgi:hypothetical protein